VKRVVLEMSCESQGKDGREKVVYHDFYFVSVHHRVDGCWHFTCAHCMYWFSFFSREKDDEECRPFFPSCVPLSLVSDGFNRGNRRESSVICLIKALLFSLRHPLQSCVHFESLFPLRLRIFACLSPCIFSQLESNSHHQLPFSIHHEERG